jgi:RNA polymerase sigma-70 factor (ECF subfamily)
MEAMTREATVARLWNELSGSLRSWFLARTSDPHLSEDLLQECFLRVHDRLDQVQDEERLAGWIRTIARNLLTDHRRRATGPSEELEEDPPQAASEPTLDEVVAGWLAPTIEELPPTYRDVLRLTELEGVPQREAAERLGLTLPALKSRVLRGREQLRERILQCCQLEFDRRGGVAAYRRSSNCCTRSGVQTQDRSGSAFGSGSSASRLKQDNDTS